MLLQQGREPHIWTGRSKLAYARVELNVYRIVLFSLESYERLCRPAMNLLRLLGDGAASPGGVCQASFVAGTLRVLSVTLIQGKLLAVYMVPR
jgi:hypothetical protein